MDGSGWGDDLSQGRSSQPGAAAPKGLDRHELPDPALTATHRHQSAHPAQDFSALDLG